MTRSERKTLELSNRAERTNRRPVAIVNPVTGGRTHLSPERAAEHVAAGIAAYRRAGGGLAIEFFGHRHEAAALTAARQARNLDFAVSTGVASHDMIAAIPVVRPADLIGPSPRRNAAGWKSCVWKNRSTRPTNASGRPL